MKRRKKRPFVHYLAMWGCISTGLVYGAIGVIALLSFFKLKKGGADEASFLVMLDDFLVGRIVIWLIISGMICYIIWRVYETIRDPYGYGKDVKGLGRRAGTALSGIADAMIALSAIQALLGTGGNTETGKPAALRELTGKTLENSWGDEAILGIGIITSFTAIVQILYVVSKTYMERLDIQFLKTWKRKAIHVIAWAGHCARGIILGIIGFFLISSALSGNQHLVVNTDKAFDFIGDHVGHTYFILVAVGTICYGIFMIILGIYYDSDKDRQ